MTDKLTSIARKSKMVVQKTWEEMGNRS
ncbi:unnamed protein product [Linum tenue]|uniref:Uncharacterized protein n=1 Tax=Linum tenue TaxID=586396 RepID=A0AAV0RRA3_9ROSI|nr:unnamed protein product [Linum tenue]